MDYQIIPNCKNGCDKIKKRKEEPSSKKKHQQTNRPEDENDVYILQPKFKAPKSTKDIIGKIDDDVNLAVKAISDSNNESADKNNKCGQFNHFTMSRKGVVKYNGMSRAEEPFYYSPIMSPTSGMDSKSNSNKENQMNSRRPSYLEPSNTINNKHLSRERMRRASAGDMLIKKNPTHRQSASHQYNTNDNIQSASVVKIGPDEVLLIPQHKRMSPDSISQASKRQDSALKNNRLQVSSDKPIPRRKSFHDWTSMQEWYSLEPRPLSSDVSTRKNVISPNTLSRMLPSNDDQGPREGSASISVCAEGDRMRYNFNLPGRRLLSHKELKRYSLPYSDNIGLEETVTSEQAVKTKQSIAIATKKKFEVSKQTPKQVWYRTVRSILAANHLYHSVKKKTS